MSQGPIEQTGNPLDVAIDGEGFLAVQTAARRALHPQRRAADQRHRPARHQRRRCRCSATAARSSSSRPTATSRSAPTAPSACAKAPTQTELAARQAAARRLRQSAAAAKGRHRHLQRRRTACTPQAGADARIVQGAIEKSNVRGVVEMSRMIEVTRAYTQIATHAAAAERHAPAGDRQARRSAGLSRRI